MLRGPQLLTILSIAGCGGAPGTNSAESMAGTIQCWSDDPIEGSPPSGEYTQVSVGYTQACALDDGGVTGCWEGVSGLGEEPLDPPVDAPPFVQVSVGYEAACGLGQDGDVTCWYSDGPVVHHSGDFLRVGASWHQSCALDTDGELWCWDNRWPDQLRQIDGGDYVDFSVGVDGGVAQTGSGALRLFYQGSTSTGTVDDAPAFSALGRAWYQHCGLIGDLAACISPFDGGGASTPPTGSYSAVTSECGMLVDGDVVCWSNPLGQPKDGHRFSDFDTGLLWGCGLVAAGL